MMTINSLCTTEECGNIHVVVEALCFSSIMHHSCCPCLVQGATGFPGFPGFKGSAGTPGSDGAEGRPGRNGSKGETGTKVD